MKLNSKVTFLFSLTILILVSIFAYHYLYQDHRNISEEQASVNLTAEKFYDQFLSNTNQSVSSFINKTVIISGKITEINATDLTIDDKIFCKFDTKLKGIDLKGAVVVKGRCIDYDDLIEQIKLDQCTLVYE